MPARADGAQAPALKNNSPVAALQRWVAGIDAHVPGTIDEALTAHASLPPSQRTLLVSLAAPFTAYLAHLTEIDGPQRVRLSPLEKALVKELAGKIIAKRTFPEWLHRAVMFETDVAVLAPELTAEAMRGARNTGMPEAIHGEDGEAGERNVLNWHWALARDLLDARDLAASDPFTASWYHAVALYMLDQVLLGELEPHLMKGFQMFPTDPRIQFDDACLADVFGARRVQAVLISSQLRDFRLRIPSAEDTNLHAKVRFARVLELDMNFVEARVRLARLQIEEGRDADALALLATAFKLPMKPELEYMAHLFAGRANAGLGQTEAAAAHFNAALELFPTAQTPVVGLSHLYLQAGELERAASFAASLRPDPGNAERNDPWWSYFQATWMGEGTLLDLLRDEVRR
jgi:hypothetical protein